MKAILLFVVFACAPLVTFAQDVELHHRLAADDEIAALPEKPEPVDAVISSLTELEFMLS